MIFTIVGWLAILTGLIHFWIYARSLYRSFISERTRPPLKATVRSHRAVLLLFGGMLMLAMDDFHELVASEDYVTSKQQIELLAADGRCAVYNDCEKYKELVREHYERN